jgi:hypothetical protein
VIFKIFYSGAQEICFLGSIVTNLHNKLGVIYTFYLQRDMYTIYTIYTIYKFLMKSFHGKNCFGFAGMNTSVQGRPPLHHYSSFQSLFFSENIFLFFYIRSTTIFLFAFPIHTRDREQLGTGSKTT